MAVPRCAALRRDGQPCGALAATPEAEFCRHHERLVEEHGEEAVRTGRYPRRRSPRGSQSFVLEETHVRADVGNGVGRTPSEVRPALGRAAADSLQEIQHALLDAALGATREHWISVTCPDCGKKQRAEIRVPDVRARVTAIELLLREGLGRPPQAEEPASPRLPRATAQVEKLSWDDMTAIFAAQFAGEIAAVAENGGAAALRDRVTALDGCQRQLLRDALDEVAVGRKG